MWGGIYLYDKGNLVMREEPHLFLGGRGHQSLLEREQLSPWREEGIWGGINVEWREGEPTPWEEPFNLHGRG